MVDVDEEFLFPFNDVDEVDFYTHKDGVFDSQSYRKYEHSITFSHTDHKMYEMEYEIDPENHFFQ